MTSITTRILDAAPAVELCPLTTPRRRCATKPPRAKPPSPRRDPRRRGERAVRRPRPLAGSASGLLRRRAGFLRDAARATAAGSTSRVAAGVEASWADFLLGPESDSPPRRGRAGLLATRASRSSRGTARRSARPLPAGRRPTRPPSSRCSTSSPPTSTRGPPACRRRGSGIAESREQVLALRDELVFPLIVKPRLSHLFEAQFGRKHVIVPRLRRVAATPSTRPARRGWTCC